MRREAVATGTVVACLIYSGSLIAQVFSPSVKNALSIDLGSGLHPAYYGRVGLSLCTGFIGSVVVQFAGIDQRFSVSESRWAWAVGVMVGLTAAAAIAFP